MKYKLLILVLIAAASAFFSWKYLSAEKTLTVPVVVKSYTETEKYIQEKMLECKDSQQKSCYQEAASDFLSKFPLADVLEVFAQNEQKEEFFKNCHLVAHYLGQEEYNRTKDVRKVFEQSSRSCLGGTYHGAVEGYFMSKGILGEDSENLGLEIAQVCGKQEEYSVPQYFIECNHGLGHALMFITDYDLVKTLKLCDNVPGKNEQELCYTGALMANSDGAKNTDHPSKYIDANDPLYPCPILEKKYQNQCYTYGVLSQFQSDVKKSMELCTQIPSEFQKACFQTVGRDRTMISSDPVELTAQCALAPEEFKVECMKGTAYNLVVRFGAESSLPFEYCGLQNAKEQCYGQVINAVNRQSTDPSYKKNVCEKIPQAYKEMCE